jgi:D-threo-aldose 1-dehydrogenase
LNRIDILFVHDIGDMTHGKEQGAKHFKTFCDSGLKALQKLKSSGAISGWGFGVNETQVCLDIMERADIDCILLAGRYTLLDRSAETALLEKCAARNTSLVVGGVFNSGILATGITSDAHFNYAPASADIIARVRALEALAAEFNIPLAAAAMQFTLRNPVVSSVLVGTSKASSFMRNIELLSKPIPEEFYQRAEQFALR